MTGRRLTKALILIVPLCVGVYDFAMLWYAGDQATISRVMLSWSDSCAPLAFGLTVAAGVLAGHLWLPQNPNPAKDAVPLRDTIGKGS